MMEEIDAMGMTGFHFYHDASKFKINITSIKIDDSERRGDVSILQIILFKNIDWSILRYC